MIYKLLGSARHVLDGSGDEILRVVAVNSPVWEIRVGPDGEVKATAEQQLPRLTLPKLVRSKAQALDNGVQRRLAAHAANVEGFQQKGVLAAHVD